MMFVILIMFTMTIIIIIIIIIIIMFTMMFLMLTPEYMTMVGPLWIRDRRSVRKHQRTLK